MHREGHVGAAMLAYAPVGALALALGARELAVLGFAASVVLATAPDLDMRVPLVAHRGPTHTVWFALLVGAGLGVVGAAVGWERGPLAALGTGAFGFVVGALAIASHVASDALTPMSVRPLAPLRDTSYSFEVARAANPVANYALLALGVAATAAALVLGGGL